MPLDTPMIISIAIGIIGLLFGIYKHFSTTKVARLIYEIKEISEFNLPVEFYKNISSIPLSVEIKNIGNKCATNVLLRIKLDTDILTKNVDSIEETAISEEKHSLTLKAENLNPSESINLFLNCKKSLTPNKSIVEDFNLSMSEGNVTTKEYAITQQKVVDSLFESLPLGLGRMYSDIQKIKSSKKFKKTKH